MRMDVEPRDMTEVRTVVRGHMVRGIYLTSNFRDEQVITVCFIGFAVTLDNDWLFRTAVGNGRQSGQDPHQYVQCPCPHLHSQLRPFGLYQ